MEPKKIGEGSYGDVYFPSFPTEKGVHHPWKVSKVMEIEDAIAELRNVVNLGIRKIREGSKYFILPDEISDLNTSNCEKNGDKDFQMKTLLFYNYGGVSIKNYTVNESIDLYINVARGIKLLKDNGICHGDVKPENILVNDNITRTCRLIDFGLSFNLNNASNPRGLDEFYVYWPPEAILLYFHVDSIINSIKSGTGDSYLRSFSSIIGNRSRRELLEIPNLREYLLLNCSPLITAISNKLKRSFRYLDFTPEMEKMFSDSAWEYSIYKLIRMERLDLVKLIMEKFDVYSLGISILYHISIRSEMAYSRLYDVICKMINPDIFSRITIEEVICDLSDIASIG